MIPCQFQLFPDPDVATHRKKASQLGSEERDDRQEELRLARDQWKESGAEDPHQQLHILKVCHSFLSTQKYIVLCRN